MNIAKANGGFGSPTLQKANEELGRAVYGPATEGFHQVAGLLSPWGLTWMSFVPAPLWPSFLGMVYMQGTAKGFRDAPSHYLNAGQLYLQAAREGAGAAVPV